MFDVPREEGREGQGSGSEGSPKSSEGSPENAASTLLAPAHNKEHEQEDASRTLVLASPANGLGSPGNGLVSPGDGQGTFAALTPQSERPPPQPEELEPGMLTTIIRSEPRPIIAVPTVSMVSSSGGTSSPPFTKVERTFIHIAETTHLNVMTAKQQLHGFQEEVAVAEPDQSERAGGKEDEQRREEVKGESEGEEEESKSEEVLQDEERDKELGEEEKEEQIKSETEEHEEFEVQEATGEESPGSETEEEKKKDTADDSDKQKAMEYDAENIEEAASEKTQESKKEKDSTSEGSAASKEECRESISSPLGVELEHTPQAAAQSEPSTADAKEPFMQNILEGSVESDLERKPEEAVPGVVQEQDADGEVVCAVLATAEEEREEELREGVCLEGETPLVIGAETKGEGLDTGAPTSHQRRSRIPVPVSEEESGSDRSSLRGQGSPRHLKTRQPHLARLVLERQQSRHRQPGSASSTASEDDAHEPTQERGRRPTEEGQGRSRIPRLVTPVRRHSSPPVDALAALHPQTTKATSSLRRCVHHT